MPFQAFLLAGPTASGKTGVAQILAERSGRAILSADSMAVYRRLDIGTAKPSVTDRARVRYYGLDLAEPSVLFSVWDYRQAAYAALAQVVGPPFVTGGSGLYLKSLTHGLDPAVGGDPALRQFWENRTAAEGLAPLRAAASAVAPAAVDALGSAATFRRLLRILERARAGDAARPQAWSRATPSCIAGIRIDSALLNTRIAARVDKMYRSGLVEEVAALLDEGIELSATARQAIGYAETIDYIEGRCTLSEAATRTLVRTRRLAKRQRTWLRTQMRVLWFDRTAEMTDADLATLLEEYWNEHGPTTLAG